jgi:hypothetical protein
VSLVGCGIDAESLAVDGAGLGGANGVGGSSESGGSAGVGGGTNATAGATSGAGEAGSGGAGTSAGGAAGQGGSGVAGLGGVGGGAGDAGAGAGAAGESGAAGSGGVDTCHDGVANAGESDVDCGLPCALRCGPGLNCTVNADCASGICNGVVCATSACSDQQQSPGESDVDCGGSCASCASGRTCFGDLDCAPGLACGAGICRPSGRSCLDIQRQVPAAGDGDYVLDADGQGPLPSFLGRCDMTTDGGGWTAILHAKGSYTPTTAAVGDTTIVAGDFAKLADAQINAFTTGNRTFRLVGSLTDKSLYFTTRARFADEKPSWGVVAAPVGFVGEGKTLATAPPRQATWGSFGYTALDTLAFGLSDNGCDRYFVDFAGKIGCFPASDGKRCVSTGAFCSGQPAYQPNEITLWLREWSPREGLLASYAFDEGTGSTAADGAVGAFPGLDGSLQGEKNTRPTWTTKGHRGAALDFDGATHTHVRVQFPDFAAGAIPASDKRYLPTGNLTFALWLRTKAALTTAARFQALTDAGGGIDRTLDLLPGNVALQSYLYATVTRTVAGTSPADGSWHHVAWTLDRQDGATLFLDGKAIDTSVEKTICGLGCSDFSTATRYLVGGPPGGAIEGFTGTIDDVRLYAIPLGPEDVETLYSAEK